MDETITGGMDLLQRARILGFPYVSTPHLLILPVGFGCQAGG
jgi:hypothetical protein